MSLPTSGAVLAGKYRVVRAIGEGGMGAVFEAENLRTQKRIAIKWLQPNASRHGEAKARLLREAQAAARVRHPNVVDVYDIDQHEDALFLVMEYLEGETLTSALRRRDQPIPQLLALLLPALRGVAAAHRQGVIHRDLKPDNIFLAREDESSESVAKVLDFGISRLDPRGAEQMTLTRTGATMGTPMYMSYEQLSGLKDIDERTDVYALGVILYEALTGQPPFQAETFSELIVKVATQTPLPPKALRADIPSSLGSIVLAAMARDRDVRIPSVDALIQALTPYASEHGFRALMTQGSLSSGMALGEATVALSKADTTEPPLPDVHRPSVAARSTLPQRDVPKLKRPGRAAALALLSACFVLGAWRMLAPSTSAPEPRSLAPRPPAAATLPATEATSYDSIPTLAPSHVVQAGLATALDASAAPILPEDAGSVQVSPHPRLRARAALPASTRGPSQPLQPDGSAATPPARDASPVTPPVSSTDRTFRVNQRPRESEF